MRKQVLSVRIDRNLLRQLDAVARAVGCGRADVVEKCLINGVIPRREFFLLMSSAVRRSKGR